MRCPQRSRPWATMSTPTRRSKVSFFEDSIALCTHRMVPSTWHPAHGTPHNTTQHKARSHSKTPTFLRLSMIPTSCEEQQQYQTPEQKKKNKKGKASRPTNTQCFAFILRTWTTARHIVRGGSGLFFQELVAWFWYLHARPWGLK